MTGQNSFAGHITARNYASHAERCARTWDEISGDYFGKSVDCEALAGLADAVKSAVHFAIPDGGRIFDDGLKGLYGDDMHLPFPEITVEFAVYPPERRKGGYPPTDIPTNVCVLARELRSDEAGHPHYAGGVCEFIMFAEINGAWTFFPVSLLVPIQNWLVEQSHEPCIVVKPNLVLPGFFAYGLTRDSRAKPLSPKKVLAYFTGSPGAEDVEADLLKELNAVVDNVYWYVSAVLELCEALSCSNVETDTLQHAPAQLNAKRERKGKLPLYETKMLTLVVPKQTTRAGGAVQFSRSAPRQHLRRGHIRLLGDGKKVWVNSCVVGSPESGRVDKSYRVTPRGRDAQTSGATHA